MITYIATINFLCSRYWTLISVNYDGYTKGIEIRLLCFSMRVHIERSKFKPDEEEDY